MKKYDVIRHDLYDKHEIDWFTDTLTERASDGYNVESCGISGDTARIGWAILSKSEPDKPKKMDVLGAARLIAETCKKYGASELGCVGCPLDKYNQCLASGALLPSHWNITKED